MHYRSRSESRAAKGWETTEAEPGILEPGGPPVLSSVQYEEGGKKPPCQRSHSPAVKTGPVLGAPQPQSCALHPCIISHMVCRSLGSERVLEGYRQVGYSAYLFLICTEKNVTSTSNMTLRMFLLRKRQK